MMRAQNVIELLKETPGLSDREITDRLCGTKQAPQPINGICRRLAERNLIARRARPDGILGNYLADRADTDVVVLGDDKAVAVGFPAIHRAVHLKDHRAPFYGDIAVLVRDLDDAGPASAR